MINEKKNLLFGDVKAQSLPKKIIFLGIMILLIGVGVWFVMADVNFEGTSPSGNTTTNESALNISINFSTDFLKQLNYTWNTTTYSIWDDSVIFMSNFNNNADLGENVSTVIDSSRYGNNPIFPDITMSNCSLISDGKYDGSLNLTSKSKSYMVIPDSESINNAGITTNFTISFWMKENRDYASTRSVLIGRETDTTGVGGFLIGIGGYQNPEAFEFRVNGTDGRRYFKKYDLTIGEWYHVVLSYADANVSSCADGNCKTRFYVNGESIGSDYRSLTKITKYTYNFTVGANSVDALTDGGSNRFNGSIDDLIVYNRSLSASEVSQLYHVQLSKFNSTAWGFNYYNQSFNYSNNVLNSTNPTKVSTYNLCVSNLTNTNCLGTKSITQIMRTKSLKSNFSDLIGNISSDFYGVNIQNPNYMIGGYSYYTDCYGTTATGNTTKNIQEYLDGGFGAMRLDYYFNNYYNGLNNFEFEDWSNYSVGFASSSTGSGTRGWSVAIGSGRNVTIYNSTDAHSGSYALQMNASSVSGNQYVYQTAHPKLIQDKNYTFSIWAKGQGQIIMHFWSDEIVQKNYKYVTLTENWTQYNISWYNDEGNDTYAIGFDLQASVNITLDDYMLWEEGIPYKWWRTGNPSPIADQISLNTNNSKRSLVIFWSAPQPSFLANWSNPVCFSNSTSESSCYPYDYEIANEISLDALKQITRENSEIESMLDIEFQNEPYGAHANCVYDDIDCALNYVEWFNNTRNTVKAYNPIIQIGGPSGYEMDTTPNYLTTFMSNLTNQFDFLTFHPYSTIFTPTNQMLIDFNNLRNNCTTLGGGTGCNRIINSEWGPYASSMGAGGGRTDYYKTNVLLPYISILNTAPANSSLHYYNWKSTYSYFNCSANYSYYPSLHMSILEAGQYESNPVYLPQYTIPQKLSKLCQAQGGVYRVSDEDNSMVSCQKGGEYAIVIDNPLTEARNITPVNLSLENGSVFYPYPNITNYDTGAVYTITNGIVNLGDDSMLDSYEQLYLTSGIPPTISSIQPANLTINTTSPINFSANLTDDVGLTNATLNIMNTSDNFLITNFVEYVSGEVSVIFSALIDLADGIYKWWIDLWDDEGKETISGNYTLTVDSNSPNISLVSPTTTSTNLSQSNIYLNVTTQDTFNHSVLSNVGLKLWLRFNNETGENNTYAKDYSGYGNNASGLGGTLSNSSGKFDDCIKLNGTSYFKSTNDSSLNITDAITVSTWIKLDSYASYRRVLVKSHTTNAYPYTTYGLLLDSSTGGFSRIRMEMASGGYQHLIRSTSNLTNGVWYLVTATYNGSDNSAKIYINGVLDNSSLIKSFANLTEVPVSNLYNGKIDTNINYLTLGISSYLGDGMNGSLDESFIYDRALSLNEIQAYYNATRLDHNITNLADGNYNLTAYAQDTSGNINSTSRWITLDTTPPIITPSINNLHTFELIFSEGSKIFNLNYLITEANLNYSNYSITHPNGTTVWSNSSAGIYENISINLTNDDAGTYTWDIYAKDIAGNEETLTRTFILQYVTGGGGATTPETPINETEDTPPITEEQSFWDSIVEKLNSVAGKVENLTKTDVVTGKYVEKTFLERYIWLFIGLFLFAILVLAGRKDSGRKGRL